MELLLRALPEVNWNLSLPISRYDISIEFLLSKGITNGNYLSQVHDLTWDVVIRNPQIDWSWLYLSRHTNITMDIIKNNPDKPWDWYQVCMMNPSITFNDMKKNPQFPWGTMVNFRKDVFFTDIIENPLMHWSWALLSKNINITEKIIMNNLDKPWDWSVMHDNPNITWRFIVKNKDKRWDWIGILDSWSKRYVIKSKLVGAGKCFQRWRKITVRNKELRAQWKNVFESVLDMLKLRIRDGGLRVAD